MTKNFVFFLGSRAEDGVLSLYRIGISSKEMCVDPFSKTVFTTDADIRWTGDRYFAKLVYVLGDRLRSLQLTECEEVILKVLSFYSPGK